MTPSRPAKRPLPPPRLVVIQPEGITVYNGRERVAFSHVDFDYTAAEIEEIRVADYTTQE